MFNYILKQSQTDVLDVSTPEEKGYLSGDTEFTLYGWHTIHKTQFFEDTKAIIKLSAVPPELDMKYRDFVNGLIIYVRQLTGECPDD